MRMSFAFPLKNVQGENWCCLDFMGIKKLEAVSYGFEVKEKHTFAGGHRHRYAVLRDSIYLKFPDGHGTIEVDIENVKASAAPPRRQSGHHKNKV